jgi:hypothetical protein
VLQADWSALAKASPGSSLNIWLAQVRWLCAAAGRGAVSQPQVAAALLSADMVNPAVQPGGHGAGT